MESTQNAALEESDDSQTIDSANTSRSSKGPIARRSYLRWHWSTIFLSSIPTAVLLFIAYPCSTYVVGFAQGYDAFGWPAAHYIRSNDASMIDELTKDSSLHFAEWLPFYKKYFNPEQVETWSYTVGGQESGQWLPLGVIVNFLTGLLTFGSIGLLLEWRRRQNRSFWRITIRDLLLMVFLVSAVFALYFNLMRAARDHCQADFLFRRHFNTAPNQREGADGYAPTWFNHLTIGNSRFASTNVELPDGTHQAQPTYWRIGYVRNFGSVKRLKLIADDGNYCVVLTRDDGVVEHFLCRHAFGLRRSSSHASFIRSIRNVETLHINSRRFNPPSHFGQPVFQCLTRLVVHDGRLDQADVDWIRLQTALESIDVKAGFIADCRFDDLGSFFPNAKIDAISDYHVRIQLR